MSTRLTAPLITPGRKFPPPIGENIVLGTRVPIMSSPSIPFLGLSIRQPASYVLISVSTISTSLLCLASNRAIDNMHTNRTSMGSLTSWRVNNFTRLRNLLRFPYSETGDHVLDKPDLEQRAECSGNGCLQT